MNGIFLLSGLGMIFISVIFILYWQLKKKIAWFYFFWGGLAWIISVVLKGVASLPAKSIVDYVRHIFPPVISEPILWLYTGLLTGIFECGIALLFSLNHRLKKSNWQEAVGYGIGFGSIEALLLGVWFFILTIMVIYIPSVLPPELIKLAPISSSSTTILADIIERITSILLHTFSCVLIIFAVQNKEWKWFWISFWYKTAIDAIAGYLYLTYDIDNLTVGGRWIFEIAILPFGIIGFIGTLKFKKKWQ
jgi:uncharacterized membrane protein YhfC